MREMALYDPNGNRLSLTAGARAEFLSVVHQRSARDRTLYETLHYIGCHPSELVEFAQSRIDLTGGAVAIRLFKKRRLPGGRGDPRLLVDFYLQR
jgi:integrase/recombinase XerD